MINIITKKMEEIKNPELKAFAFRIWNTFKSIVLPIVLSMTLLQLQNNPNDLSCLGEKQYWINMIYAILVAIIGSAIAGLDKISRMKGTE